MVGVGKSLRAAVAHDLTPRERFQWKPLGRYPLTVVGSVLSLEGLVVCPIGLH
jgi:hypothetical protein